MDRIAAPTLSSSMHMAKTRQEVGECPKCCEEANNAIKVPQSRRWWSETTRHLTNLRTSLVKQKILPAPCKKHGNVTKTFVTTLVHSTKKIDEIVAKSSKTSNIPIYPKLRLTRPKHTESKIPVPVTVHLLQFPKLKPHHICTNPFANVKNVYNDVNQLEKQWLDYVNGTPRVLQVINYESNVKKDYEEEDLDEGKVIPFYNVQVCCKDAAVNLAKVAEDVQELSKKTSSMITLPDENADDDVVLKKKFFRRVNSERKMKKMAKKQSVDIGSRKLSRSSLKSLLERITLPTHASMIKAHRGALDKDNVLFLCETCRQRASRSGC